MNARPGSASPARRGEDGRPARRALGTEEVVDEAPILVVDGTGLLVRCSRAAIPHALSAPDGTPTATLMLFISALARQIRQAGPSHVMVAWDGPEATSWRRAAYPGYKGGYPGWQDPPAEVVQAWEFCAAAGIFSLAVPGFEADDLLAWATRAALHLSPKPLLLCSDDEDMHQLLSGSEDRTVHLASPGHDLVFTAADVERQWGLSPMWVPKIRALSGDRSDRIPGLPGVGPKRALRMLLDAGLAWPLPRSAVGGSLWRELTVAWRDIQDLVLPLHPADPELSGICHQFGSLAQWNPEGGHELPGFLNSYGMTNIYRKLQKGSLWGNKTPCLTSGAS